MFSNKNFKKIFAGLMITICFFGVAYTVKSITLADIELFITLGIIPAENAERARGFLDLQKTVTTGSGNIIQAGSQTSKECLIINQNLVKGKSGTLVSALQRFLKSEGYFPEGQAVTGYFGDITAQAVADFQLITGLIKTGNQAGAGTVGPLTQEKIKEISCAAEIPDTIIGIGENTSVEDVAATEPVTPTLSLYTDSIKSEIVSTVKVQDQERYLSVDTGTLRMRYQVYVEPPEAAQYLEVILMCDESALEMESKYIEECGRIFRIDPIRKGKKSINVSFKNKSKFDQPIIFALEAFDKNRNSLGFVEKRRDVFASKPVINIQMDDSDISQSGTYSLQRHNCSYDERLDFIRYTMTPYNPANPVTLPVCWPGEMLCNKGNPPTYCEIKDGPSSDDLCSPSQKFENGQCVAK